MITIDASFISLDKLLPVIRNWYPPDGGGLVALIKPQFEAGRQEVNRGEGVITDPEVHYRVVVDTLTTAQELGFDGDRIDDFAAKRTKGQCRIPGTFPLPIEARMSISRLSFRSRYRLSS